MLNLFKKKITTDEVSSSLYLLIKENLVDDDIKDNAGNVLITMYKQRLFYLSRFYDFLEKRGFNTVKMRLVLYWTSDNHKTRDESEYTKKMINVLASIQDINKLFSVSSTQEEFTSQWLNTKIFGKELNLEQRVLITSWCTENSQVINELLVSTFNKFKISDSN